MVVHPSWLMTVSRRYEGAARVGADLGSVLLRECFLEGIATLVHSRRS